MAKPCRFFDLQVNGYGGIDFNRDGLTIDEVETACALMLDHGVAGALATLITEDVDVMAARIAQLAGIIDRSDLARRVLRGIHIEGPFISPEAGYRGAHPLDAVRPADLSSMQRLVDSGGGHVRLATLAPEYDESLRVTRWLAAQGVAVAAGHCNPSLDMLIAAVDAGLTLFTHLGNGCPLLLPRHDNIIQRVLSLSDRIACCFIADGVHVPFPALRNYIRAAGVDRCIVVTDATAPAGLGPGRYTLSRWDVEIGDDLAAWAPGGDHLLGSACTMKRASLNLAEQCGFTGAEIDTLTGANPRKALDLSSRE